MNFIKTTILNFLSPEPPRQKLPTHPGFEALSSKWRCFFEQLPEPFVPLDFKTFRIVWNHRMRSRAGLCRPSEGLIELNPHLLKEQRVLEEVFVHELCHLAVSRRWPHAQAHGQKWKKVMTLAGFVPKRCHDLIPQNRHLQRRWNYSCACQIHEVSTIISNRIKNGRHYKCRRCGKILT